jgi:hypothetical protein
MQVSIFVRAGDRFDGRPLFEEIIFRALAAGLSGATAIRGVQGFGESARMQPAGYAGFNGSEPVRIDIADQPDRVALFLEQAEQLLRGRLVVTKLVLTAHSSTGAPDLTAAEG